jgi:hypothetical protein
LFSSGSDILSISNLSAISGGGKNSKGNDAIKKINSCEIALD